MDGETQPSISSRSSCTVPSVVRRIYDIDVQPAIESRTTTTSRRYPPISSIPRTSETRLAQPDARPSLDPFPVEPIPAAAVPPPRADHAPNTVLYLAYGSNLASSTFMGRRGIRPISQLNVSAPSLQLVFDLPGMPYSEPCFANTAPRKIPKPPKLPPEVPKLPPEVPDLPDPPHVKPPRRLVPPTADDTDGAGEGDGARTTSTGDPVWNKGLIGVVYEVTASDFAKILATEGGGASYSDILVPVLALPANVSIPERPPVPELPRPFLAHTLYAPSVPSGPGGDDGEGDAAWARDGDDDGGDKPRLPGWLVKWLAKFLVPRRRPDPNYAQPSGRYLGLLREGAREHDLPGEYQEWLAALSEYRTTSARQVIGKVLFGVVVLPAFVFIMVVSRYLVDEKGRAPWWVAALMGMWFSLVWKVYDVLFKPVFGDGERTEEGSGSKERKNAGKRCAGLRWRRQRSAAGDEEKRCLMEWSE